MARPQKTGLEYFPHDCDLSNDEKIESIEALYGNDGYAMFLKLLERIYRNGGELNISAAETMQILCKKCGINTIETFQKMLLSMTNIGLFDKTEFENNKLLTSNGIKKRCECVKNKRVKEQERYKEKISAAEMGVEMGESKVKESKVNKSKENKIIEHPFFENLTFKDVFKEFIIMRQAKRKSPTARAKALILKELEKYPVDTAVKMLEESIKNSWTGVFPLKTEGNNEKHRTFGTNIRTDDEKSRRKEQLDKLGTEVSNL